MDITINPINDAPTVVDSAESTDEDTQVTISFNGDDVDGDELIYTIIEQTQNGLIVNNNDGTATYTPNAEFNGEDSFTYIANDGVLDSEDTCMGVAGNQTNGCPETTVTGCNDSTANNYDSHVNTNDGSCDYDFDDDGVNDTSDVCPYLSLIHI